MKKILLIALVLFNISSCRETGTSKVFIHAYSGRVTVNGQAVHNPGHKIKYGDIINTDTASYCDIIIDEKNIIRLQSDTSLEFRIYGADNRLGLEKGCIEAVFRKGFTKDGIVIIKTSTATASIRGTSFCVKVENANNTYFCVCNGSIFLEGTNEATGETVTASEHAARRFTLDKKSGFITIDRSPGLIYHDSKLIENLAAVINEKTDWSAPDVR